MSRKSRRGPLHPDAPLLQTGHPRPVTRRQFVSQGFMSGAATVIAPSIFGLFANPSAAEAALSPALEALKRTLSLPRRQAFEQALTLESLMHQVTLGAPGAADTIRATYVE